MQGIRNNEHEKFLLTGSFVVKSDIYLGNREVEVCIKQGEGGLSLFHLYYERLWGQHKMVLQIKSTFEKPQELFKTRGLIFTVR